ncbi:transglutaminase-like domain-containing protein [Plantactinospora sp. WMMB334]|uniref:transglutaminase-like domain-containing protein n=1 Tax=Plantactinospora sp. WMMB334 TaxID=3404119 RepID=UPI003B92AE9D
MNFDRLALVKSTEVLDYGNPAVSSFVEDAGCYRAPSIAGAVERLHDAVRDGIDYNVFNVPLHEGLRASEVVTYGSGFCLHKSLLFVAGCRKLGVPAVLCSDIVTNHVADRAMLKLVGGDEFLHWYAQIYLNGRWCKAAPVFNALLCSLYGIEVLRFNPHGDAVRQQYRGNTSLVFMGGERRYPNPDMREVLAAIQKMHPRMVTPSGRTPTSQSLSAAAHA